MASFGPARSPIEGAEPPFTELDPMKTARTMAAAAVWGWLVSCIPGYAADSAAGQKIFEDTCSDCHELKSYAGKSESELEKQINGIVAGTVKHKKKLTLTAADVANVATYISSNEPK
jgi:mono/diheme cytochrome c family protein